MIDFNVPNAQRCGESAIEPGFALVESKHHVTKTGNTPKEEKANLILERATVYALFSVGKECCEGWEHECLEKVTVRC